MNDEGKYICEYATYPSGNEQGITQLVMLGKSLIVFLHFSRWFEKQAHVKAFTQYMLSSYQVINNTYYPVKAGNNIEQLWNCVYIFTLVGF